MADDPAATRKAVVGASIGNAVEWFDLPLRETAGTPLRAAS
jgi:hypothetical protein